MNHNCLIVSGFLEAGKTSYINEYIKKIKHKVLIISTEQGEIDYDLYENITLIKVKQHLFKETLFDLNMYDEIIVEYNGTWDTKYFLNLNIFKDVKLKWIHLIDGKTFDFYLKNMYDLMIGGIINCDEVIINNTKQVKPIYDTLKMINPKLAKKNFLNYFVGIILLFMIWNRNESLKITTIFSSIILQAIPFLLLGVIISSCIQIFFDEQKIESLLKKYPKWLSYPITILISSFLPVCDCATIPIATRLVQKKIPLPQVLCFILASTCLNPLVLASTYYAFASIEILFYRLLLTLMFTLLISITFSFKNNDKYVKSYFDLFICSSGYIGKSKYKFELLLRHASLEFLKLLKYVFIGATLSTIIQFLIQSSQITIINNPIIIFIFLLLSACFISVCSTSNAFIARSLSATFNNQFALIFMVIGSMLDVKNILLLKQGFTFKFIVRYITTIILLTLLCFIIGVLI